MYIALGTGQWEVLINGVVVASGTGGGYAFVAPCVAGDIWTANALTSAIVLAAGCPM